MCHDFADIYTFILWICSPWVLMNISYQQNSCYMETIWIVPDMEVFPVEYPIQGISYTATNFVAHNSVNMIKWYDMV